MNTNEKPIKKWDMMLSYILGSLGQFATIICWFLPTFVANPEVITSQSSEVLVISVFSVNERLPFAANLINILFLIASIISLIWISIPLFKNNVMKPRNMIFPCVFNAIYIVLFLVRSLNAWDAEALYAYSTTFVSWAYFIGILLSGSLSLSMMIYNPRLKRQMEESVKPAEKWDF